MKKTRVRLLFLRVEQDEVLAEIPCKQAFSMLYYTRCKKITYVDHSDGA